MVDSNREQKTAFSSTYCERIAASERAARQGDRGIIFDEMNGGEKDKGTECMSCDLLVVTLNLLVAPYSHRTYCL